MNSELVHSLCDSMSQSPSHDSSSKHNSKATWEQQTPQLLPLSPNDAHHITSNNSFPAPARSRSSSPSRSLQHLCLSPYRIQRHLDIRAKLAVESELLPSANECVEDEVRRAFRTPARTIYSRGHEIHEAGADIARRPPGTAPIVCRGQSSSYKYNVSTSLCRPLHREHHSTPSMTSSSSALFSQQFPQKQHKQYYSRNTCASVVAAGTLSPSDPFKHSFGNGSFKHPLNKISYPAPSSFSTNLAHADLPPEAFFILQDSIPIYISSAYRQKFLENMKMEDRVFISRQRTSSRRSGGGRSSPSAVSLQQQKCFQGAHQHQSLAIPSWSPSSSSPSPYLSPSAVAMKAGNGRAMSPWGEEGPCDSDANPDVKREIETDVFPLSPTFSDTNDPSTSKKVLSPVIQELYSPVTTSVSTSVPLSRSAQRREQFGFAPSLSAKSASALEPAFALDYSLPGDATRKQRHICRKPLGK